MPLVSVPGHRFDVDAVVFDKDGTLIDLDASWVPAALGWLDAVAGNDATLTTELAERLGVDITGNRLVPDGVVAAGTFDDVRATTAGLLVELGWTADRIAVAVGRAGAAVDVAVAGARPVMLGDVVTVFGTLADAGLRIALLTSDDRDPTLAFLRELRADHLVHVVVTATDVDRPKPHPDGLERIVAELEVSATRTLMIGDSVFDRQAARAAGAWFVAVGHGTEAAVGADASILGIDELTVG
jgi:phosphoglycolate phosphatase-like HAD superfamily hydrolase